MFIVEGDAPLVPGMCLVTKKGPGGPFVDLGRDFDIDHVGRMYIHISAVRDLWNVVKDRYEPKGPDPKDVRIAELEAKLGVAEKKLEAIYVLKQTGFSTQKKPGRKPKQKEPISSGS